MRFVIFTHSLVSDWNHGNAHFLRGICGELVELGHELAVYEPEESWSRLHLIEQEGVDAIAEFHRYYPKLNSTIYNESSLDLEVVLKDADVVLVHEWNSPELIARIGQHRSQHDYCLLFHDTHHRGVSERDAIAQRDLSGYDGVLAYGEVLRRLYLSRGWAKRPLTWHEAADTRLFHPLQADKEGEVVWIGNWGDNERAETLREYLIRPIKELGLRASVYGVRYPDEVLEELAAAGISYRGWLPNYRAPEVFARYRITIHVPRKPYVEALPGIPTIRPFEALACSIPLVSSQWKDSENLFRKDTDFVFADSGSSMRGEIERLLSQPTAAAQQAACGLETIRERHTCAHRVQQLLQVISE